MCVFCMYMTKLCVGKVKKIAPCHFLVEKPQFRVFACYSDACLCN